MLLVAIIVAPCMSQYVESHTFNTTLVHACPNTVTMVWEEHPEGPQDYARRLHYWTVPRDDRPPFVAKQEPPKAEPAKQVKKKAKRKKKKRRS
jgi:hypothetical protein